jgi:phospholipid/cholesterol/gamma-HCH transport system permease protein
MQWHQETGQAGSPRLVLSGSCTMAVSHDFKRIAGELHRFVANPELQWDLTGISQMDDAGVALFWQIWQLQRPRQVLLRPEQEKLFQRPVNIPAVKDAAFDPLSPFIALGQVVLLLREHLIAIVAMLGQLLLDAGYLVVHPARIPWREISANLFRTGAQALAITGLVGFLIGVVLSYLMAGQLQMFGANIFLINILGVSIIRELGPILAAILVAGRSGSSMTAQLGVMRVTQELDALTVMGIPHSLRLVLPKVIGLAVAMPLVVLWTSAIALIGGIVVADMQAGLGYQYSFTKLAEVVPVANLWLGLGKGVACGIAIALIACHFGLRVKPNTESLGKGTTSSVVTSITAVIVIDAIFAIVFSDVGIR